MGGGGGDCGEVGTRLDEVSLCRRLSLPAVSRAERAGEDPLHAEVREGVGGLRLRLVSASRAPNSAQDDRDFGRWKFAHLWRSR